MYLGLGQVFVGISGVNSGLLGCVWAYVGQRWVYLGLGKEILDVYCPKSQLCLVVSGPR